MSFFKKRLSSLLPGEGARASLQHVLTVEWGDHKTVLIDVPQAGPSKSNEVEMYGISRTDYGDYGRLMDEDDEEEGVGRLNGRRDRRMTKRRSFIHSKPSHSGHRVVPTRTVSQPLPPPKASRPPPPRRQSTNPFDGLHNTLDPLDEDMAYARAIGTGAFNREPNQVAQSPDPDGSPYDGLDYLDQKPASRFDNPWEGRPWSREINFLGDVTDGSKSGTRDSAGTTSSTSSNPFRQSVLPPPTR